MKNFLIGTSFLMVLFLVSSCKEETEPTGSIYVTVQNNLGVITDAQVSTEPASTTGVTDLTGAALLADVPVGGYKVNVTHPSIGSGANSATVSENEVVDVNVFLPNSSVGGGNGGNSGNFSPPYIDFQQPANNSVYDLEEEITFWAFVSDSQDDFGALSVEWTSNLDGILSTQAVTSLGTVELTTGNLSEGEHLITLNVTDSGGLTAIQGVMVIIKNFPDPVILESVDNSADGLIVNWTVSEALDFTSYKIMRSESQFENFEAINNINDVNQTSYMDELVDLGVTYYYKVAVQNGIEETDSNIESNVYEGENIELGTEIVRMKLDSERPYIYALDQSNNALLFINKESKILEKTITVGLSPSDMSINLSNDKMYIANFGSNEIAVIDLETQEKINDISVNTQAGSWEGNPYRIACLSGNQLVFTSEDQWNSLTLVNAENGTVYGSYGTISEPGLLTNAEQTVLYVTESGSSGASAFRFDLTGNSLVEADESSSYTNYSLRDASVSGNSEYLFYLKQKISTNNLQNVLGTFGENIHACNADGTIAIGSNSIWNAETFSIIKNLPLNSQIMLLDSNNSLYVYNQATSKIVILSID